MAFHAMAFMNQLGYGDDTGLFHVGWRKNQRES